MDCAFKINEFGIKICSVSSEHKPKFINRPFHFVAFFFFSSSSQIEIKDEGKIVSTWQQEAKVESFFFQLKCHYKRFLHAKSARFFFLLLNEKKIYLKNLCIKYEEEEKK